MIICGCKSDKGIKKSVNQDRIISCLHSQGYRQIFLGGIFDGVSALNDSELVAEMLKNEYVGWFDKMKSWVDLSSMDFETMCCHVADVLDETASEVYEKRKSKEISGASTASVILATEAEYYILHVGDSKVFLLREGNVSQLTEDQSMWGKVGDTYRMGLMNYIGRDIDCEFAGYSGKLNTGDMIIFGSDGFFNKLEYREMLELESEITENSKVEQVLDKYIDLIKNKGETDNISVGICKLV